MKRGLLTLIFGLFLGFTAIGKAPLTQYPTWTFGAEWSYHATFLSGYDNYFYAPEGFRVNDNSNEFTYNGNGETLLHVGYNINQYWNLSFYTGYTGLGKFHTAIPFSLRATRYYGDNHLADRWFTFIDIGSGVSLKKNKQEIITGKIGGGYRLSLSRLTKVDFILALRSVYTHPEVEYYGEKIDQKSVIRNDGYVCSISFGIGITF